MVNFSTHVREKRLSTHNWVYVHGMRPTSALITVSRARAQPAQVQTVGRLSGELDRAKEVNALKLGWWQWDQERKKSFQGDIV